MPSQERTGRIGGGRFQLQRFLATAVEDIRSMAEVAPKVARFLPEVADHLGAIRKQVDSLDEEVKRMRAGVEVLHGDVIDLMRRVERIEPHLDDVSRAMRPLKRASDRVRRLGNRDTDSAEED